MDGKNVVPQTVPQPDRTTGEPRPPHAPLNVTPKASARAISQRSPLQTPVGEGPVLEWHQETGWDSVLTGLVGSLFIAGFATLKAWGLDWVTSWPAWLFIAAPVVIFYLRGRGGGFAAGADWFATSKKRYVKLYELTEVTVTNPPGLQAWGLELRDRYGGFAGVSLREIQQHQALWDLVYNGIARSVLRGSAQANDRAREMLQLSR